MAGISRRWSVMAGIDRRRARGVDQRDGEGPRQWPPFPCCRRPPVASHRRSPVLPHLGFGGGPVGWRTPSASPAPVCSEEVGNRRRRRRRGEEREGSSSLRRRSRPRRPAPPPLHVLAACAGPSREDEEVQLAWSRESAGLPPPWPGGGGWRRGHASAVGRSPGRR